MPQRTIEHMLHAGRLTTGPMHSTDEVPRFREALVVGRPLEHREHSIDEPEDLLGIVGWAGVDVQERTLELGARFEPCIAAGGGDLFRLNDDMICPRKLAQVPKRERQLEQSLRPVRARTQKGR